MPNKVYLGFDFGLKRIGVAVGQTVTKTAQPLKTIHAKNGVPDWMEIKSLIDEWKPDGLIVGLPLNMDGTKQPITRAAENFVDELKNHYTLPTHIVDERLTTVAARSEVFEQGGYKALKKAEVDTIAAQIILEEWMNNDKS